MIARHQYLHQKKNHLLKVSLVKFVNQLGTSSCPRSYIFLENKLHMSWHKSLMYFARCDVNISL